MKLRIRLFGFELRTRVARFTLDYAPREITDPVTDAFVAWRMVK